MPRYRPMLGLLVIWALLTTTAATAPMTRAQTPVPRIAWGPCSLPFAPAATPQAGAVAPAAPVPDLQSSLAGTGLQCAAVPVPLDYADPDGPRIEIGIARLPARDPARRIGNLFVNPGGPGASGVEWAIGAALGLPLMSDALRDRFDVIGFDPRGVGTSTPVLCDPDLFNEEVSLFPRNQAEFDALVAHNRAFGESCLRMTGPLLAHIDTVSAARDIEAVRLALGGETLRYLGLSYGTALGAQYAALYPDQIRAMALDAALDHNLPEITMLVDEASSYEASFNRFVAWCAEDERCALHGQDVAALFDDLVARADASPLPAVACADGTSLRPCRPTVRGEDIRIAAGTMLLFKEARPELMTMGWNGLAEALAQAAAGDASQFSPTLATSTQDRAFVGGPAIACLDFPSGSENFDDFAARELLGRVVAPRMRGASQTWTILASCLGWPARVVNPPHPANVTGAPPILIVNATHDPSTPYPWAVGLLTQIAGSVLLTREGDGHTTYLLPGPSRTRDAIDAYLISGETPPPNTVYAD
jgi:pimeloyl-ACP methyl ester carboxylesterase